MFIISEGLVTKSDVKFFYFLKSNTFSDNNSRNQDQRHNEIDIMKNNICQIIFNSSNEN